ncbi:MAG: lamin tail domain-containing protein [Verrucomicrobia bacterium]|nr:lamin tail domain-containing protein [Verrucomicrobiota bacterium]
MKPKTHLLVWLALGLAPRLSAQVVINEFLADNEGGLRTQAGDAADWIELANPGSEAVDLSGWYLTDRASDLTKWRIPDGTSIPAQGYLVVFADSSTNAVVGGELHASFSLSREGEYLGLVRPDGTSIAHEYAPSFPPQLRDISYGLSTPPEQELLGANTPVRYRVPTAEGAGPWREGVGSLGFSGALIETDVAEGLWGVNTRLDAEWSFTLESAPAASDQFTLWVRCADGFVATPEWRPVGFP